MKNLQENEEFNFYSILLRINDRKYQILVFLILSLILAFVYNQFVSYKYYQSKTSININNLYKNNLINFENYLILTEEKIYQNIENFDTKTYGSNNSYEANLISNSTLETYDEYSEKFLVRDIYKKLSNLPNWYQEKLENDITIINDNKRLFDTNIYNINLVITYENNDKEKVKSDITELLNFVNTNIDSQFNKKFDNRVNNILKKIKYVEEINNIELEIVKNNLDNKKILLINFLTEQHEIAKKLNIKGDMSNPNIKGEMSSSMNMITTLTPEKNFIKQELFGYGSTYYLKGYEVLSEEIQILKKEKEDNFYMKDFEYVELLKKANLIIQLNKSFLKYLNDFDFISFDKNYYLVDFDEQSIKILAKNMNANYILVLIISIFISVVFILFLDSFKKYRMNKI